MRDSDYCHSWTPVQGSHVHCRPFRLLPPSPRIITTELLSIGFLYDRCITLVPNPCRSITLPQIILLILKAKYPSVVLSTSLTKKKQVQQSSIRLLLITQRPHLNFISRRNQWRLHSFEDHYIERLVWSCDLYYGSGWVMHCVWASVHFINWDMSGSTKSSRTD